MAAPEISRSTSPPPPFEQSLTTEDRQRIQRALAALGHLAGVADGSFGPGTRAAIKQFQSFQGDEETSQLTQPQRDALLGEATNLSMALERPDRSPRGVPARSLEGSTERWRRGFEHEAGNGAPKDLAEAVYWYGLAGADGQSAALQALGNMAVRGQGFAKPNPAMAERLWRAAAARGEAAAQHHLGVMFERGIGTTANRDAAISWYRRAAALRYADATAALKRLGQ